MRASCAVQLLVQRHAAAGGWASGPSVPSTPCRRPSGATPAAATSPPPTSWPCTGSTSPRPRGTPRSASGRRPTSSGGASPAAPATPTSPRGPTHPSSEAVARGTCQPEPATARGTWMSWCRPGRRRRWWSSWCPMERWWRWAPDRWSTSCSTTTWWSVDDGRRGLARLDGRRHRRSGHGGSVEVVVDRSDPSTVPGKRLTDGKLPDVGPGDLEPPGHEVVPDLRRERAAGDGPAVHVVHVAGVEVAVAVGVDGS